VMLPPLVFPDLSVENLKLSGGGAIPAALAPRHPAKWHFA